MEDFYKIDFLGLYGAIVATLVFLFEIFKAYKGRKTITVLGNHQLMSVKDKSLIGHVWKQCILVTVTNNSDRNCDIHALWFISEDGKKMLHVRQDLPKALANGAGYSFQFHKEDLGEGYERTLKCRRIVVQTTDNKEWTSGLFPYSTENILKKYWKYLMKRH